MLLLHNGVPIPCWCHTPEGEKVLVVDHVCKRCGQLTFDFGGTK